MKVTYIKVPTAHLVADMTRYIGYNDVPETAQPQLFVSPRGYFKAVLHRYQDGLDTFFMKPKQYNENWTRGAVDRYASFGVKIQSVRLDVQ